MERYQSKKAELIAQLRSCNIQLGHLHYMCTSKDSIVKIHITALF